MASNVIYKFLNKKGKVIYVGQSSKELLERLRNHNHLPTEIYDQCELIKYFECEPNELNDYESACIQYYNPIGNRVHPKVLDCKIDIDAIEWSTCEFKFKKSNYFYKNTATESYLDDIQLQFNSIFEENKKLKQENETLRKRIDFLEKSPCTSILLRIKKIIDTFENEE